MISVIIPVYNSEKYISRCIDSVLRQSYTDFELILVNDGSTDLSGQLCDEYELRDRRIRVIHKKNGGAASARNAGLDNAKGDYVAFIDSDDWVETNYLSTLLAPMLHNREIDVVFMPILDNPKGEFLSRIPDNECYIEKDDAILKLCGHEIDGIWSACSRLYRKALFANQRFFDSMCYGEDLIINLELFLKARTIYFIPRIMYHYFQDNKGSVNHKKPDLKKWFIFLKVFSAFIEDDSIIKDRRIYKAICLRVFNFYEQIINLYILDNEEYKKETYDFCRTMNKILLKVYEFLPDTALVDLKKKTKVAYNDCLKLRGELKHRNDNGNGLFIYGAGRKGKRIAELFGRNEVPFNSFIVSGEHAVTESPDGKHSVIHLNEALSSHRVADMTIVLALKEEFAEEVLQNLDVDKFRCIFYW